MIKLLLSIILLSLVVGNKHHKHKSKSHVVVQKGFRKPNREAGFHMSKLCSSHFCYDDIKDETCDSTTSRCDLEAADPFRKGGRKLLASCTSEDGCACLDGVDGLAHCLHEEDCSSNSRGRDSDECDANTDCDEGYICAEGCCGYNQCLQLCCEGTTTSTTTTTTDEPTTAEPTTAEPTTAEPTTAEPTTADPTTADPTTAEPTTAEPTTAEPTTADPTTAEPTTADPTTAEPTTAEPTTAEPTTAEPTTAEPTTAEPTTAEPTTAEPTTAEPTTADPTTAEPTTAEPTTAEPTTAEPTTAEPTTAEPTTAEPTTAEPTTAEPTTAEPTTAEPTTAEPTTAEPTTAEPTTVEPTVAPTMPQPTSATGWPTYGGLEEETPWPTPRPVEQETTAQPERAQIISRQHSNQQQGQKGGEDDKPEVAPPQKIDQSPPEMDEDRKQAPKDNLLTRLQQKSNEPQPIAELPEKAKDNNKDIEDAPQTADEDGAEKEPKYSVSKKTKKKFRKKWNSLVAPKQEDAPQTADEDGVEPPPAAEPEEGDDDDDTDDDADDDNHKKHKKSKVLPIVYIAPFLLVSIIIGLVFLVKFYFDKNVYKNKLLSASDKNENVPLLSKVSRYQSMN